jgi:hypothetical protein
MCASTSNVNDRTRALCDVIESIARIADSPLAPGKASITAAKTSNALMNERSAGLRAAPVS